MNNFRTLNASQIASLILLIGAFLSIANAQTVNLQLQNDYTTGNANSTPASYAVGDVNNDGKPDLVELNKANATAIGPIAVFLNNGAGGFAAPINITDSTGLSPNVVLIGDFNKDGFPDLALANDGISNGIQIRLGNGTGNFPTGTYLPAERGVSAMVVGDFNGDGNLDLAGIGNSNDLRVYNGNGLGGFAAVTPYTTSFSANDIVVSDFNVDGKPDLAVVCSGLINIFLNNGAGVFTLAPNITGIGNPNRIVTADFNRDCIPDLAISSVSTGNTVKIILGNGSGGFGAPITIAITNQPEYMTVGDFNRDKKVDLAIRRSGTTAGQANFTILLGNGAGDFGLQQFELTLPIPTSSVAPRLAVIDANLDGKLDIVIGRQGGFFLYNGNSSLFTRTENDFDGDLRTDLSVFRPSASDWYVQQSTKGFSAAHWGISSDKPVAADYDGDGKTDLAVWRENGYGDPNRSYFFILRSSDNTFQQEQFGRIGDVPGVAGDWDGDGKADVAVYRNGAAAGDQSYFFYRPSGTAGVDFRSIAWGSNGDQAVRGDFDGDGKQDAAVFRPSTALWYVLQSANLQVLYRSWGLATDKRVAGDYDGDGKTDFAVFRPGDTTWYILNSSTGTATYRQWGTSTDTLTPGDYNGDGKTDVAVYRPSEQRWYVPQCADFKLFGDKFGTGGDVPVPSSFVP